MVSIFARFAPRLQEAIVSRLGWSSLRPVQELAGAALLDGMNAVVLAPTAGGKTEAAMFPTLSTMVVDPLDSVGTLYVAPTKALLNNQSDRLGLYTEMVGLHRFVWHGDIGESDRRRFLRDPSELLMTTPESLEVMLVSQRVDATELFRNLRTVIIDEIHSFAGTDRGAHLQSVLERIARLSRHDVQRIGLSATVGNPDAILGWLQGTSQRAGTIVDPPKQPSRRQLLVVRCEDQTHVAHEAARLAKGGKSFCFCQSRRDAEAVAEQMNRAGTAVFVHHSSISKEERLLAEERFQHGSDVCIVCTSTLELGIDVGDLDRILQAEAPATVSSFLQRMGRTGRREGQASNTTFLCEYDESVLQAITLIELAKSGWVENADLSDRCWPVFIHQILALALANSGVSIDETWGLLSQVPDFRGITRPEFDNLAKWMIEDESLIVAGGRLALGPTAERRFGRRNFLELFSVFTTPECYTVETISGQPLGTLSQSFVDHLVDGIGCFLLGGRPWSVLRIQHDDRRIFVEPAQRGVKPLWGGFLPQFLSREICQKTRDVLLSDETFGYLSTEAAASLNDQRGLLRDDAYFDSRLIGIFKDELRWWTFAGGRINSTLRVALTALDSSLKIVPDNCHLKIHGDSVSVSSFWKTVEQLRHPDIWNDESFWNKIASSLPNFRLSKFQPLMPPWVEREILANYLLDISGTRQWLETC